MKPQTIEKDGKPAFVVLPIEEWERIRKALEEFDDIRAFDLAKARNEEVFPASVVDALISGRSPVRVYREHRKMNQAALARAVGIAIPYLSQIETGKRTPSLDVVGKLANALGVTVTDLV